MHARDVAPTYLERLRPTTEEDQLAKDLATSVIEEEFDKGALSQSGTEVFVASFSSAKNLKSQWNEYADNEQGVSIAFDLRFIRPAQELEVAITLAPCVYESTEKDSLIESALQHFMQSAASTHVNTGDPRWVARHFEDWQMVDSVFEYQFDKASFQAHLERVLARQLRAALAVTKFDLLRLASHCKNPYFSEEREWRLALPHTKNTPLTHVEIKHRGENGNIPYIAHDLFSGERLPITKVLLGARCDAESRIRDLLDRSGYDKVTIERATSPVRRTDQI